MAGLDLDSYHSDPCVGRIRRASEGFALGQILLEFSGGYWAFCGRNHDDYAIALLLTQIDKILLSRLLPLQGFAVYATAGVLSSALYLLSTPIGLASFLLSHSS